MPSPTTVTTTFYACELKLYRMGNFRLPPGVVEKLFVASVSVIISL